MYNVDIIPWFYLRSNEISQRCFKWFVLLSHQFQRRDDVSAWSGIFKLVTKMGHFILGTRQYIFTASLVVQSLLGTSQYVATTSQSRRSYLGTNCNVSATY